ncbi:flagellar hook-basal body complex protein [Sphingobium sufflavum]|uniref:flagellar hook protein FlgE n=1 Tax=Sphingobium sufflavum TaxID=1129547 RepID=UPI001F22AF87|nr:flagellar hook-basal body complex protein [Sphingobium sufflavum]MCE7797345.1 flagellar hook-basal body complex protein [Sphingobium sufflavum]
MSFYISLSGLKGAQADLTTISNNVANVGATAFKKSRAEFGDIYIGQSNGLGQGTRYLGAEQQFTQGTLETTDKTLDLAVTGEGFFTVKSPNSNGQISYTRNGAFGADKDNFIVDTLGNRVQVLPVNNDGKVTSTAATALTDLKLPADDGGAIAPSPYKAGSAAINATTGVVTVTFDNGTTKKVEPAITIPKTNTDIPATDVVTSNKATIDMNTGVVTVSYQNGQTVDLPSVSLVKYAAYTDGNGVTTQCPLQSAVVKDNGDIELTYASPYANGVQTMAGAVTIPATHKFEPTFTSAQVRDDGVVIAKFADNSEKIIGTATIPADDGGSTPSPLSSIGIDQAGLVVATFANGTTRKLGSIAMADFTNQQGLLQSGDAHWTVSNESGEPAYGGAADGPFGQVRSGMLERSNVDITEELVALIAAQRNFQANSKALEASNTLSTTINNIRA